MARTTKRKPPVRKVKQPTMTDKRIENLQVKFRSLELHQETADKHFSELRSSIKEISEMLSKLQSSNNMLSKRVIDLDSKTMQNNTVSRQDSRPISTQLWELWQSRYNQGTPYSDIDDIDELQEFFNIILARNTAEKWDKIGSTIAKIRHSS